MDEESVSDLVKTWKSFLSGINESREYREYHLLENHYLMEIEDRNIRKFKASLIKKLVALGEDPGLLDQ